MTIAAVLRGVAMVLAMIAIVDPRVPAPHQLRGGVRVIGDAAFAARLNASLAAEGFTSDGGSDPVATVLAAGTRITADLSTVPGRVFAVLPPAAGPRVTIASVTVPPSRLPGQSAMVRVRLLGEAVAGATSRLVAEDSGIPVASLTHVWSQTRVKPGSDQGQTTVRNTKAGVWDAAVQILPSTMAATRLRVRVTTADAGVTGEAVADVLVPPQRGPLRTLVLDAGATWPAAFLRRAIEGHAAFDVAAQQRTTRLLATRAGTPPRSLQPADLVPYEAVIIGNPDDLSAADLDGLRWFVERRGGLVVFVPNRTPRGRYMEAFGAPALEDRTLQAPIAVKGDRGALFASELVQLKSVPAAATVLAADESGGAVVFASRRGEGAVVFSGALDAWRYRDRDDEAFARFWRSVLAEFGVNVPPTLDVSAAPGVVRPGDRVRITARLRPTLLADGGRIDLPPAAARAVSPSAHVDEASRMWPTAEPGVYAGEWPARAPGEYALDVGIGESHAAAVVHVAADATRLPGDEQAVRIAVSASDGRVVRDQTELIAALRETFPAKTVMRPLHPARSPWWATAFALLLGGEWWLRRRAGLP